MKHSPKSRVDLKALSEGIVSGDRVILGQAITLMESNRTEDQEFASALLEKILPYTGKALRIGITGIPGVGKSTFIEALGKHIISQSKRLAVLSIDPSSPLTRGSILGDKTRMDSLSKDPMAFIRPTPAAQALGGVAMRTRECMLLCEAAGYNVIIIETVGVGQSEVAVKNMVDFFLLLMLAGAGDELQGMKKGIIELADSLAITKVDGPNREAALKAQSIYTQALHLFSPSNSSWQPTVLATSALTGEGIQSVWNLVLKHHELSLANGDLERTRRLQHVAWFKEYFTELLNADMLSKESLKELQHKLADEVANTNLSARAAAFELMQAYRNAIKSDE